jgi:hypothetical protein
MTKGRKLFRAALTLFAILLCTATYRVYSQATKPSLNEARHEFRTHLTQNLRENAAVDQPPDGLFDVIAYDSPVGKLVHCHASNLG